MSVRRRAHVARGAARGRTGQREFGQREFGQRELGQRASDRGFLPLSLAEYCALLEWTVRNVVHGGCDPSGEEAKALKRVGISAQAWLPLATRFGKLFQRVAGAPQSLASLNTRRRFRCRQAELLSSI
jgi:hypothetical protein